MKRIDLTKTHTNEIYGINFVEHEFVLVFQYNGTLYFYLTIRPMYLIF